MPMTDDLDPAEYRRFARELLRYRRRHGNKPATPRELTRICNCTLAELDAAARAHADGTMTERQVLITVEMLATQFTHDKAMEHLERGNDPAFLAQIQIPSVLEGAEFSTAYPEDVTIDWDAGEILVDGDVLSEPQVCRQSIPGGRGTGWFLAGKLGGVPTLVFVPEHARDLVASLPTRRAP